MVILMIDMFLDLVRVIFMLTVATVVITIKDRQWYILLGLDTGIKSSCMGMVKTAIFN